MMDMVTRLRYYHFIAGMLANQQHDPFCSVCKAFTNSLRQIRQEVNTYMTANASALKTLPEQVSIMLADVKMMLDELHSVEDAVGQKKAGNCLLPQGVCFVKSSKGLIDRVCS